MGDRLQEERLAGIARDTEIREGHARKAMEDNAATNTTQGTDSRTYPNSIRPASQTTSGDPDAPDYFTIMFQGLLWVWQGFKNLVHPKPSKTKPLKPKPKLDIQEAAKPSWLPLLVCVGAGAVVYYSGWWPKLLTDRATDLKAIGLVTIAALLLVERLRKIVEICVGGVILAFVIANIAVVTGLIRYQQPAAVPVKQSANKPSKKSNAAKSKAGWSKQHSSNAGE